jgi:hypothetical protein
MITIQAWRSSIGAYNGFKMKSSSKVNKATNFASDSTLAVSALIATLMSAKLIGTLLIIGCVEANPGPITGVNEGKNTLQFNYLWTSNYKMLLFIDFYISSNEGRLKLFVVFLDITNEGACRSGTDQTNRPGFLQRVWNRVARGSSSHWCTRCSLFHGRVYDTHRPTGILYEQFNYTSLIPFKIM